MTEYKPGISPKDNNFFMSKKDTEEIKQISEVSVELDKQVDVRKEIKDVIVKSSQEEINEKDFMYIRGNMMQALETGQEAIADLMELAKQSGHPRAYEVMSLMLKTVLEGNKQLMEVHKDYKEITTKEEEETPQTVNNNLFVGTTSELHKLLKSMKDK